MAKAPAKAVPAKAIALEGSRALEELTELQNLSGGAITLKAITLPWRQNSVSLFQMAIGRFRKQ
jgi:hypothetical protein